MLRTEKMGPWGSCRAVCKERARMGGKEARPESARASASMAQAQELSGQLGLCLPIELRENEFLERLYLNGQAKAVAPHPSELLFWGIRRWWVGEACTVYWGLGPRALESFSKFRKEERGRMERRARALVPCLQALLVPSLRCLPTPQTQTSKTEKK